MNTEMTCAQKTARAMAALDTMATIWAASFDMRHAVKALMRCPDAEDRLIDFIKQGHAEGLYAGRTSHQAAAVEPLAAVSQAGQEPDKDAEIAALKKENEAFKAVTTTWTDAATDFRDAVLHGLDGLDSDQTNTVLSAFDDFLPIARAD